MSVEALITGLVAKFEGEEAELRVTIMKALKDAKFLEDAPVAPAIIEKKAASGTKASATPTAYTLFVRHWNVQLKSQYPDFTARQQVYIQMWKALSTADKKAWSAPNGAVPAQAAQAAQVAQPVQKATRHQTGYQAFVHGKKHCPEVLACTPGAERFKKLGAMWQALKNVPVEGQAYWNQMAKEEKGIEVAVAVQAPPKPKVVIAPAKVEEVEVEVEEEEEEEDEIDEADESEDDE
jgi:hypothetical protein